MISVKSHRANFVRSGGNGSTLRIFGGSPNTLRSGAVSCVLLHETATSATRGRIATGIVLNIISWEPPGRLRPAPERDGSPACVGGPEGLRISNLRRKCTANAG